VHQLSSQSSKLSNYPEKVHRDVMAVQLLTRVVDSSRCEEYIINSLQHQKEHIRTVKTEDSMKSISGFKLMKSGSTKASNQCLPNDRSLDQEPKLPGLTTCSAASDDTTYVPGPWAQ
jgi:hypothetical protein